MDKYYGGVIWTNHIFERMAQRGLSQQDVLWVFNNPDKTTAANDANAYRFYRVHKNLKIEVVAKKENGQWILMSCWTKPIFGQITISARRQNRWSLLWRIPQFILNTILGR